jgi:ATP adenylyltransferase
MMVNYAAEYLHEGECRYCDLKQHEPLVLESNAGHVVPSLGALVEGWLLVFPKRHVLALSDLSTEEWAEFRTLIGLARSSSEREFGQTVLFEHGSAGAGRTAACGVNHAHMHVVPLKIDLRAAIAECSSDIGAFEWSRVIDRPVSVLEQDYIYVSDDTGQWVARSAWLPGQVVRRAIARFLDLQVWDWKVDAHLDLVESTRRKLKAA